LKGKFRGRNRFFARLPSSSDLKRRENAKGNVKGNGTSRKALITLVSFAQKPRKQT
jgi:hypothetical protein